MKKMMNIVWSVFFLLGAFTSRANGEVQVEIQQDQTLVVQLEAAGSGTVLFLQDMKGTILFKDSLFTNKPYKTSLHLKLLPEGTYFLNVEEDVAIRSWTFDKAEDDLRLREETPEIVYKPEFRISDDLVRVFMRNPGEAETTLSVYDPEGKVVGTSGDKDVAFRKALDFSQVPQGLYRIHIQSADRTFLKTVRIQSKKDPGRISMVAGNGF